MFRVVQPQRLALDDHAHPQPARAVAEPLAVRGSPASASTASR
ncbi:hypothetical protein [Streptomyces sp. CC210A]|nr:hypothetical protein [Streptomyces sp. CC210A]